MSFEEILDAEVAVNMFKLREASRLGIPAAYRGTVYRYLLGVAFTDKSSEMMVERIQDQEFQALVQAHEQWKLTGEIRLSRQVCHATCLSCAFVEGGQSSAGGVGGLYSTGVGPRPASKEDYASARMIRESGNSFYSGSVPHVHDITTCGRWNLFVNAPSSASAWFAATLAQCGSMPMKVNPRTSWEMVAQVIHNRFSFYKDPSVSSAQPWEMLLQERRKKVMLVFAALQVYFSDATLEFFLQAIQLTLPLEPIYSSAKDLFFCARALLQVQTHHQNILQDSTCRQWHCGTFLMLFRSVHAPLYQHFYKEQVTVADWVPDLLSCLFAGFILHPGDLLSLWDHYLADVSTYQGFRLHPYVCLAILMELTEELIECDREEILYRLHHLPRFDVPGVLRKAVAIQESASGLVEEYYSSEVETRG